MNIEVMQAESIISQFIEFYQRAIKQMASDPNLGTDLPPVDDKAAEELIMSLNIMKMIFITNLSVKSTLKEAGMDPDEWDDKR